MITLKSGLRGKILLSKGAKANGDVVGGRMLGCLCNSYYALGFDSTEEERRFLRRCRYYGMEVCFSQKAKYNYRLAIYNRLNAIAPTNDK